jgi:hypothetical protein
LGRFCFNTATCCRSARISTYFRLPQFEP